MSKLLHNEVEAMQIEFDDFCMPLSGIDDALYELMTQVHME